MSSQQPVPADAPRKVFLSGYRGTGKSTVARLLAERLKWDAIDSDDEIVRLAGKSIVDIFAEDGEPAFRALEEQVVAELCQKEAAVVALGGGAILRAATRTWLRGAGPVVWLTGAPETLAGRIDSDAQSESTRPRLTALDALEEVRRVLADREPLYRECATLTLSTDDRSPEAIADEIADRLFPS